MVYRESNPDRIKALAGAIALQALLGYALITGLGFEVAQSFSDNIKIFDVPQETPPPPVAEPPPELRTDEPEGAAAPPNIRSRPTPVVAPPREIELDTPSPVVSVPMPLPVPLGNDPSAGASDVAGPGTGAGGEGSGTGSGNSGTGQGAGGGSRAERVSGGISGERDYPRAARRAGIEGNVAVRFTVETNGRVTGCRVIRSSGNAELDATTCRLAERRFVYRPAQDAQGRPVREVVSRTFDWLLPARR